MRVITMLAEAPELVAREAALPTGEALAEALEPLATALAEALAEAAIETLMDVLAEMLAERSAAQSPAHALPFALAESASTGDGHGCGSTDNGPPGYKWVSTANAQDISR